MEGQELLQVLKAEVSEVTLQGSRTCYESSSPL